MTQRNTHGGARAGAGRKGGPSEVVRLPLPIAALARRLKSGALRAGDINEFLDVVPRTKLAVPLMASTAACGFPSPADDYLDSPLDFNMKELLVARRGLVKDRVAANNRNDVHRAPLLKRLADQRLRQVERQIVAIDAELRALCKADTELKARLDILVSIPAIGEATALTMLIEMPELGAIENKCAASLAGLAPIARDSGQRSGKRFIRGGRAHLRQALYMPALVAIRFNADMKAKYQALLAAGKPPKVAITAVMRKLTILANVLLREHRNWIPKAA